MKTLIVADLIDKKVLAEAIINREGQLDIVVKEPEIKTEIESLLQDLFARSKTYRINEGADENNEVFETIAKEAKGEERLYAIWDAIAGSNYEIGGQRIRAYVREEDMECG